MTLILLAVLVATATAAQDAHSSTVPPNPTAATQPVTGTVPGPSQPFTSPHSSTVPPIPTAGTQSVSGTVPGPSTTPSSYPTPGSYPVPGTYPTITGPYPLGQFGGFEYVYGQGTFLSYRLIGYYCHNAGYEPAVILDEETNHNVSSLLFQQLGTTTVAIGLQFRDDQHYWLKENGTTVLCCCNDYNNFFAQPPLGYLFSYALIVSDCDDHGRWIPQNPETPVTAFLCARPVGKN
ncbi:unnamed protein product [Bursaphelenchus xylophilus]|nr:unnamed protein product [Bursaphelenchus xylophilus]CAG9093888.1 unnamed protein product [Bursaphelenchus xylophilus]